MSNQEHKENTSGAFETDKKAVPASEPVEAPETQEATPSAEITEAEELSTEQPTVTATPESTPALVEMVAEAATAEEEASEPEVEQEATAEVEASELEVVEEIAADEKAAIPAPPAEAANAALAAAEEEESEEEDGQEEEEHDEASYAEQSTEALVALYVETSKTDVLSSVRSKMNMLRDLLEHRFQDERNEKLTAFLEAGNKAEDFAPNPNPLHLLFLETANKYNQRRAKEKESREQSLLDNYRQKESILAELQQLIEDEETKGITDIDKLRALQQSWKEVGAVPPAQRQEQWQKYHFLIDKFYDNLRINRELKELDLHKNLEAKMELCEKAEELLLENSLKKAVETLNALHEQWKQVGPVPREQKEVIWERFKAASDKIYEKRKTFFQGLDAEREGNLVKKTALCEQIEAILTEQPKDHQAWAKLSEKVDALQAEWKSTGFAPKAQNTTVWRRFKLACDQFYTAKNLFYRTVRQEQIENLHAKEALCEKAEALKDSDDWKVTTDAIIQLQKEWKKIGAVNRKASDKVWNRFRAACDHFFARKNEHFGSQDARQEDNLKAKIALIEAIEGFVGSGDQKADLDALKEFQRNWLEIGFIPIKQKAEINERYRKALNTHFDGLKISQSEKSKLNFQNKVENLKAGKDGDKTLRKEQFQIQNRISHLKNDILLWENNMGFFAQSRNADMLKKEIEQKIEKARNEIEQLHQKLLILRDT